MVIPRRCSGEDFWNRVKQRASDGVWNGITILSLQPADPLELRACGEHANSLGRDVRVVPVGNVVELLREVGKGSSILSQRYHGALAAIALEKTLEVVPQAEGDKLRALTEVERSGISHEELQRRVREGEEALRRALRERSRYAG